MRQEGDAKYKHREEKRRVLSVCVKHAVEEEEANVARNHGYHGVLAYVSGHGIFLLSYQLGYDTSGGDE